MSEVQATLNLPSFYLLVGVSFPRLPYQHLLTETFGRLTWTFGILTSKEPSFENFHSSHQFVGFPAFNSVTFYVMLKNLKGALILFLCSTYLSTALLTLTVTQKRRTTCYNIFKATTFQKKIQFFDRVMVFLHTNQFKLISRIL